MIINVISKLKLRLCTLVGLTLTATIMCFVGPASAAVEIVFDDMEHGDPLNNGWIAFNGIGGGGISSNNTDLPSGGDLYSLESNWVSGGQAGFYGSFGRSFPTDLSGIDTFEFWINPDAGQEYTLEIQFYEDDNSDGVITQGNDDEFQFNCVVGQSGACAVSGAGWQKVTVPFSNLFSDNSFLFGGNEIFDAIAPSNGGNGELIRVLFAVVGTGTEVDFRTDNWAFTTAVPVPSAIWLFGSTLFGFLGLKKIGLKRSRPVEPKGDFSHASRCR